MAPLTLARFGAGVAALEGKLFAVGGRVEEDEEAEVEEEDDEAEVEGRLTRLSGTTRPRAPGRGGADGDGAGLPFALLM